MVAVVGKGDRMRRIERVEGTAKNSVSAGCSWLLSPHRLGAQTQDFCARYRPLAVFLLHLTAVSARPQRAAIGSLPEGA